MLIAHAGIAPRVAPTAWAADCRVPWGARLIGEGGGRFTVGRNAIIPENTIIHAPPGLMRHVTERLAGMPGGHRNDETGIA